MAAIKGSSSTEVDAPIDRCWGLIEDVAIAPEWQNGLERMDVVERDEEGRPVVCDTLSDAKLRKAKSRVRFTYEGPTKLSWHQLEGDLNAMEGSWELEDLGGNRTRVTYTVSVDPGSVGLLARGPIERAARAILVNPRPKELASRLHV